LEGGGALIRAWNTMKHRHIREERRPNGLLIYWFSNVGPHGREAKLAIEQEDGSLVHVGGDQEAFDFVCARHLHVLPDLGQRVVKPTN
jgi:hypothetical protein